MGSIKNFKFSKGSKKGYFLSLLVTSILIILTALTIQIVSYRYEEYNILRNQLFSDKISFTVNDILMDIKHVLRVNQLSNSSNVIFEENYKFVKSTFLSNEQFNLELFENVSNMNISLTYSLPLYINLSNEMIYITNETNSSNKETLIYNRTGSDLNVNAYYINIVSNKSRGAYFAPSFGTNGTYVRINYTDPNNALSFVSQGYLNPNITNTWEIRMGPPSNNITITFGLNGNKTNSLRIRQYDVNAITFLRTNINFTSKNDIEGNYSIFLNISTPISNFIHPLPIR